MCIQIHKGKRESRRRTEGWEEWMEWGGEKREKGGGEDEIGKRMFLAQFISSYWGVAGIPQNTAQKRTKMNEKNTFANTNCNKLVVHESNYVQVSSPVGGEAKPIYLMVWEVLVPWGGLVVSVWKWVTQRGVVPKHCAANVPKQGLAWGLTLTGSPWNGCNGMAFSKLI